MRMGDSRQRADVWLAQENSSPEVTLIGLPWAPDSPGEAAVPLFLRERFRRFSTYQSERETDFGELAAADGGNWPVTGLDFEGLMAHLRERIPELPGKLQLFVGGANGITGAIVTSQPAEAIGLINFSSRPSAISSHLAGHEVVLVGAQGFAASADDHEAARSGGTTTISNLQIEKEGVRMTVDRAVGKLAMREAIHVSVDLDVLDQSHVPGSPAAMPGGLTVRQLSDGVRRCGANTKVRTMDFVGADAHLDSGHTLDVLAHVILSAVAGYAERSLTP